MLSRSDELTPWSLSQHNTLEFDLFLAVICTFSWRWIT